VGLAIKQESDRSLKIGAAIHDGTYSVDFAVHQVTLEEERLDQDGVWIAEHILGELDRYRQEHVCKILGAGVIADLHKQCPMLCSRLWAELDIVPIVVTSKPLLRIKNGQEMIQRVDELADSAARKCLAYVDLFGCCPRLTFAACMHPRSSHVSPLVFRTRSNQT
jgi:alpha,alpha-trehalose phosphorylase (configuration-retaining)